VNARFIFFNGCPPPPLHLQSMVGRNGFGRNGLFSGYKSQRTKGHKGTEGKLRGEGIREKKNTIERRTEPGGGDTKKPGSGDKKSHKQERRNQRTELYRGEQIFAPISSQRNRGVRASQNT